MAYRCATCGEIHEELPDIGVDRPDQWWDIPEDERDDRIKLTSDTCIIDDDYFIRGVIEIPLLNNDEHFGFGVWVSQKKEHFLEYVNHWDSSEIGPFFGWLCTRLACYKEDTFLLKTKAHFRGKEVRPLIELEPTEHPLSVAQRQGMSLDKAWEIAHFYLE